MSFFKRLFGKKSPVAVESVPLTEDERLEALQQIDEYAARDVAAGFRSEREIIASVTDMLSDDFEAAKIEALVVQRTQYYFEQHATNEATWSEPTDCDRLDLAFAALETRGVICRQDFSCCGNCGSGEILTEMEDVRSKGLSARGYAFYHIQDTERAVDGGGVYLSFGSEEKGRAASECIAREICSALNSHGLTTEWNGSADQRILVKLDWKRRRIPTCAKR
jgi:hypothetical protein